LAALALLLATPAAAAPRPFTVDDLVHARRVGDFAVSPDGKWVAYVVSTMNLDENRATAAIHLMPTGGGPARPLTAGQKHDGAPRFSPDGQRLAFTSDRDGAPQIYLLELRGGEARPVSRLAGGVSDFVFSPDGRFLVAASEVYPECASDACNRERAADRDKRKVTGRLIDRLLYRHWDSYGDGKRTHLIRVDLASGDSHDLTPGNWDAPGFSLGGMRDFDVSPDGQSLVYASNHDPVEAISTNSDLWEVATTGGRARCLTCDNPAADRAPRYSPDGRSIGYLAQRTPGYESDREELRVLDRAGGAPRPLTTAEGGSVDDWSWTPDGKRLLYTAVTAARAPIYEVPATGGQQRHGSAACRPAIRRRSPTAQCCSRPARSGAPPSSTAPPPGRRRARSPTSTTPCSRA
jgi:Tol biopolymer transport system component